MAQQFSGSPATKRLSPELLQALKAIQSPCNFTKGEVIFKQESAVRGVYLVEQGEIAISLETSQGQRQVVEMAGDGAVLGLSECMSGANYRVTAATCKATTASFIPRDRLMKFLKDHPAYSMEIVRLLSEELHGLYDKFRSISSHPGRPRRREPESRPN